MSLALRTRYERTGSARDLQGALDAAREALKETPIDHSDFAKYLSNVSSILVAGSRNLDTQEDGLDLAVATARQSIHDTPSDHPELASRLSHLSIGLMRRFELSDTDLDLGEAIEVGRQAVTATPADHPNRATYLSNLGHALQTSFERTGDEAARVEAMSAFEQGIGLETAAPLTRANCGRSWARLAGGRGDWAEAERAWEEVLNLVPLLVRRDLGRADRQHHLSLLDGLGPEAAVVALQREDIERAWELLELGRGVLANQAMETRSDPALTAAHPTLAADVDRLRTMLNVDPSSFAQPETPFVNLAEHRRKAIQEWDRLLSTIRGLPDFERYGLPPRFDQLRNAVTHGAAVAVNVTDYRCDALVLGPKQAGVVHLPMLTQADTIRYANTFLAAVHDPSTLDTAEAVGTMLTWLWNCIAEPVLQHLGCHATPDQPDHRWPRIWWIPTGPLSVLPLHAAGHHTDPPGPGRRTVLDRVLSSYTPTARMLLESRRRATPDTIRPLVVGLNAVAGQPSLQSAENEAVWVSQMLSPRCYAPALLASHASRSAVQTGLSHATWAHFACHAAAADDPADSHLVLHDGRLAVRELADLEPAERYLAYLSSCTTGYGGTRLLDESIHIASAFQLAGFQHVIATLWPVIDRVALRFAKRVYPELVAGTEPALAVHRGIHALRDAFPQHPHAWAAHLHFGP